MFKKAPQVKSSSNIKTSERRHLLSEICKEYKIDKEALSKEQELHLLPAIIKQATYHSFQEHKGTVYFDESGKPIWFTIRGSAIYPTIFTLWQAAYLLPIVLTNSHVISRIAGGANLLLPGCIPPFDSRAARGSLVAISSYTSPSVVMAIGTCALNLTQFDDVQGRQGVAVTVMHRIEDELFNLYEGDKTPPSSVSTVTPSECMTNEHQEDQPLCESQNNTDAGSLSTDEILGSKTPAEKEERTADKQASSVSYLCDTVEELSVEDLDNFFVRSFLQSVKNHNIELPISASRFMSEYVLKNLPQMDTKYASIKKTSWKKSAKFLKALEKLNYISLKGKGDDVSIVAITVPEETVSNFVTHKTIESGKNSKASESKKKSDDTMSVLLLYRPTSKTRMIFNKLHLEYQRAYTKQELKSIVNEYVKAAALVDKSNPKLVNLDDSLASAISSKNGATSREKILDSFLKNFLPNYAILGSGEDYSSTTDLKKGEPRKIKILTQTVLGRKKTTTIVDFEHFNIKAQQLADDLRNKCSGSTAIGPSKHNPSVMEVMVQGPHGPTIIEYLKGKGIPTAYIEFEDKSKGKKKH